nr:PREDICTED: uncharacterized protein LOC105679291 [Linepithema humile]
MVISGTYTEALDCLILLERTETAFSQNSEDDEEKMKKAKAVYRQKRFKKDIEEIKHLLNEVPAITKNSCNQSDQSPTMETYCMESPTTPTMLLDTRLPVISENDLMDYTNDKELNPLNININIIWSKLLMLESESRKINKKLDLISIKFESLLHDTKIK